VFAHVILSLHGQLAEPIGCGAILIDGDMSLSLEVAPTKDAAGVVSKIHLHDT
jgi:hypothetical protein